MSDERLGLVANLSGSAAKLLAYTLLSGSLSAPRGEIMRLSGIGSTASYYLARAHLLSLGLISSPVQIMTSVSKTDTGVSKIDIPKIDTVSKTDTHVSEIDTPVSKTDTSKTDTPVSEIDTSPSWIDEAEDMDAWPTDGGHDSHGKTNWQKRRNAQVSLLQRAWVDYLHGNTPPLTEASAKKFLRITDGHAVDVLEAFDYAGNIRQPPIEGFGAPAFIIDRLERTKKTAEERAKSVKPSVGEEYVSQEYKDALELFDPKEAGWGDDLNESTE